MSTVFTMPGKLGDAIHQWAVAAAWLRESGKTCEAWLDEKSCKPLVPLLEVQPGVDRVALKSGVENYNCGGQPFHMNLSRDDWEDNLIYHLGMRGFPQRQISLQCREDSKVPINATPDEFANTPSIVVPDPAEPVNRVVLHGQGIYAHNRTTPGFWRFLASIRTELEGRFDEIVFVGSADDRAVGLETYPDWSEFDDGGDFLKLARFVKASRLMIGVGSSPITVAGALKVPAVRVHDPIGNNAPKMIWDNLGENQLNDEHATLRTTWPKFRDRWL